MCKKRKTANKLVVLNGAALEITKKIDVNEMLLAMYKSLLKDGTIKNYDEFLSYCFANQKDIRSFIYPLRFKNLENL